MSKYYNSSQLIDGIRTRDDGVFKFIDRRYKSSIFHLILELGGTLSDADDIFQDGVLSLIEIVDDKDFNLTAELSTLLYAICKRKWKLNLEKRNVANKYFTRKLDDEENPDYTEEMDRKLYCRFLRFRTPNPAVRNTHTENVISFEAI